MMQLLPMKSWISLYRKCACAMVLLFFFNVEGYAQPASGVKSVDIISSYKPSIRKFPKFQFLPNLPTPDTSKMALRYSIPTQGWRSAFVLKPVMPLVWQKDSNVVHSSLYIKAGYGNFKSPYFRAHFTNTPSLLTSYAITAFHQSAQGNQNFQRFGQSGLMVQGFKKLPASPFILDGTIDVKRDAVFKYGVPAGIIIPSLDSLKNVFTRAGGRVGFSRSSLTDFDINYHGDFSLNTFSDQQEGREIAFRFRLPIEKYIEEHWSVGVELDAQSIQLKRESVSFQNSTVGFKLGLKHVNGRLNFRAGINPVWDRTGSQLLPQISLTYQLDSSRLLLTAGWEGYFTVNTYQQLFTTNNWLMLPTQLLNTKTREVYFGVKGALSPYFTYVLQGSSQVHQSMPLFVNDTSQLLKNTFRVVYEPRMVQLQLKGEINYQVGQRLYLFSKLQLNQFSGLVAQKRAWGLLPVEWRSGSRVTFGNNFNWQTDLFVWRGAPFLQAGDKVERLKGSIDLSTQLEFKFARAWQVWTRFGNLFNQAYQRWAQYPVYGLNFMAGVVFSPEPKRKP